MRFDFTREFYLPRTVQFTTEEHPAEQTTIHQYEVAGKAHALAFLGKAQKPAWHHSFRSPEDRAKHITQTLEGQKARHAAKAERTATRIAFVHSLKVGDILQTSWGYDQTNVEFFEVTEVRGKHVVVREVAQLVEETGFMSGTCAPVAGDFRGAPIRKKVLPGNGIKMSSWGRWASVYEQKEVVPGVKVGAPCHWSSYA